MKNYILIIILSLLNCSLHSQEPTIWKAFYNSDTTLIGFTDSNNTIRIEPKFMGLTRANKFADIIVAMEEVDSNYVSYYLTKSGKIVGKDSLYFFDNGADCESEGYIRFQDYNTDKMGLFDKNGKIAIPAEYNYLSKVNNGLIIALKGAKKKYWQKHKHSGCNHYRWVGGKQLLINTKNEILINNFSTEEYLDLYSVKVDSFKLPDTNRQSYIGTNGQYYSFINFKKDFLINLNEKLLNNFDLKNLTNLCYESIYFWNEEKGWITKPNKLFVETNYTLLKSNLELINSTECDYNIFIEGLNPYLFKGEQFEKYFNNCNEAKIEQYPLISLVINFQQEDEFLQNNFNFLKTDDGYKLISLTVRNEELN